MKILGQIILLLGLIMTVGVIVQHLLIVVVFAAIGWLILWLLSLAVK